MTVPSIEELIGSTSQRLTPFRDYRMIRGGGEAAYLSLFAPPQGQVLATVATRVNHFSELSDTLPDLGLPSRMKDCLVYYACWQLLSQRLPVGQEDLKQTQRQTESGTEDRSEVLDGAQLQTQIEAKAGTQGQQRDSTQTDAKDVTVTTNEDGTTTEDKTPTITGTRESTTTETKAAINLEDTNLEQTEDKNGNLTSAGTEYTSSQNAGSGTSDITERSGQENWQTLDSRTQDDGGTTKSSMDTVDQDEATHSETLHDTQVNQHNFSADPPGHIEDRQPDVTTHAEWDSATPAHQTVSKVLAHSNYQFDTTDKNQFTHTGGSETDDGTHNVDSMTIGMETDLNHNVSTKHDEQENLTVDTKFTTKLDGTSEDNRGSTTTGRTDANLESNLVLNEQSKVATANEDNVTLFVETTTQGTAEDNVTTVDKTTVEVTDEDATSIITEAVDTTTSEDNTTTVNQSTDNTTTSVFATDKVTGIETMSTYSDRLRIAQYYKVLLDVEVQSKKMRSWVARGL